MSLLPDGQHAPLPRSHCFISLVHGTRIRTVSVRTGVLRTGLAMLALLGVWLVGSTLYLVFHDDLVASLMAREAQMQYAYEDRIAALRGQVAHEASLKLVGQTTIETEVRTLAQRASTLEIRASLVADLAAKLTAGKSGAAAIPSRTAAMTPVAATSDQHEGLDNPTTTQPTGSLVPGGSRKPRPEASLDPDLAGPGQGIGEDAKPLRLRLAALTETLEHVDAAQYARIATIGERARRQVGAIRNALASAGIDADRLKGQTEQSGQGGPYVPLDPAIGTSPFGRAIDALQADVVAAETFTRALPRLPFAKPMPGELDITSPYGARLDPFLGRPAMHTGVDLREEYGGAVHVTAAGRVVSAGPAGGYGVMIEVDHGHGLSTRYAHLSAVGVAPGQTVVKGEVIGQVGATGRATGPHLHYETRIDGEAVDPMRFLLAGEKLASLEAAH